MKSLLVPFMLIAACEVASGAFAQDGGLWQGETQATQAGLRARSDRFLVLDTGGSGGGRGQGDVRQKLHDVVFWNHKLGWASGYGGVFKTEDGGLTWRRMKPRGGWYHVEMTGADEIWLLEGQHPGGLGKAWLWRSTDGGKTWNEELKGKLGHYWDLYCRGNERWALCGDSPCFRSDDGGATWRQERFGGLLQGAFKLAMPADVRTEKGLAVYVIGHHQRQPRLVKSLDSGKTWTTLPLPENLPERIFRYCLHFATSEMGWLGLTDGGVLFTADGGATWERRSLPTDQAVTALWLDQFGRGYAGASNSDHHRRRETLYETADGGKRWRAVLGGAKHVSALFGFGPGRLWAVGDVPGYVPNDLVAILDY